MKWNELAGENCSLARALAVVGDRWTLLILRDAFLKVRRFDDFQARSGIARRVLAERLAKTGGLPVREAVDGEPVRPGEVLLAPGGRHMELAGDATQPRIRLTDEPPENSCRPAADVLFRSAARLWGAGTLGVVLTGMGRDGLAGSRAIVAAGGGLIAQDEFSSVVWGMPGEVVRAGLADTVLPLSQVGVEVALRLKRRGG